MEVFKALVKKFTERKFLLPIIAWALAFYTEATGKDIVTQMPYIEELAAFVLTSFFMFIEGSLDKKKIEVSTPAAASPTAVVTTSGSTPATVTTPTLVEYAVPLDVDEYVKGLEGTNYDKYQKIYTLMAKYNLNDLHPAVRLDMASKLLDASVDILDSAWVDELNVTKCSDLRLVPSVFDIIGAELSAFKKRVMDATPGCEWLSTHQNRMLIDYQTIYKWQENIGLLQNKPVKWTVEYNGITIDNVNTVELLGKLGLQAVG